MGLETTELENPSKSFISLFAETPRRRVWNNGITYLLKPSCVTLENQSGQRHLAEGRTTKGSKSSSHLELGVQDVKHEINDDDERGETGGQVHSGK